jgi:mannitol-1-phosphate 5-dehydrogenase
MGQEKEKWLSEFVGFSESIVFRTCLDAGADQSPLTIRSQNFFELPCDGDAVKEELHVFGLKPLKNFNNQLRRKIFTYNCINAVIAYLGAEKGYDQLADAGNDEEILAIARKAGKETSLALIAEYGFDPKEQEEWAQAALAKFADKNIPDPIERNGADAVRKLNREDRLIGPALLALKHSIYPEGLLEGIVACFNYSDPKKNFKVVDLITSKGTDFVLSEICGLSSNEKLFMLIKEQMIKRGINGN